MHKRNSAGVALFIENYMDINIRLLESQTYLFTEIQISNIQLKVNNEHSKVGNEHTFVGIEHSKVIFKIVKLSNHQIPSPLI